MTVKWIFVIITFLVIGEAAAGTYRDDTIGPSKLALYSKALHTIVEAHCGSTLNHPELDDFQAFLNRRISTAEVATLAHPQHFTDLYNNLTGCADFLAKKMTNDKHQDDSTLMKNIEETSTTEPPHAEPEPETKDAPNKKELNLIDTLLNEPIQAFLRAIGYIIKKFDLIFQDKPRVKRDAYMQTDASMILKGIIEIALNECPKSNFPVQRQYLTMIGKLMALQVELGESRDKAYSKLKTEITECAMQH